MVAVGAPRRGRPLGELHRREGQDEARHVGEHVAGVGEEREGARQDAGHDLHPEEDPGEAQDEREPLPAGRVAGGRARGRGRGPSGSRISGRAADGSNAPGAPARAGRYTCASWSLLDPEVQPVSHQKKLAILVGGGPAPGINSVIGAATIRGVARGRRGPRHPRRLRVDHAGQHRPRPPAHDRRGQPDPLPRRLAHRHLAREPDEGPAAPREHRHLAAAPQRLAAHHDRRRRHRVLGDEARGEGAGPHPRRPRPEDDRQRPRPAALRRHVRLPDRAPLRRRDREEPDGRREDHVALVLRDRDGPQGRPPRARHRQGRRRDADADPRGVRRGGRSASRRIVDTLVGAIIKRLRYGRRDGVAIIAEGVVLDIDPRISRSSTTSSATPTATCASPRSTSARS